MSFRPVVLTLVFGALAAAPARGQEGWGLPPRDSLQAWAAAAKTRFQANAGDSVGGENARAYEIVGRIGHRVLRSMRGNLGGAPLIRPMLDSLGLEVEVAIDPTQPSFALLMVRNPYRFTARAVGFLYWSRGQDLAYQGVEFRGGTTPALRVWWTGKPDRPYESAVVDRGRGEAATWFTLLRLHPSGMSWVLAQDSERNAILGTPGEAAFADINRDGTPELIHWALARTDSVFLPCASCPKLTTQDTYVERREGFVLEDSHLLATGYATFVAFVRRLLDGDRPGASRLLRTPGDVTKAVAEGWATRRRPGTWQVEYAEPGESWPRWIAVRFDGPQGVKRYVVRFGKREDRWIIENWVEPKPRGQGAEAGR